MGPPEPESADFGKYRLIRKLAQGGMAEIFLALEGGPRGFERVIVLKRVLADLCTSPELVQMFLDEAKLAALLDHPNVVRTYDLGVVRGRYYLAMEYLAGEDLAAVLQQTRKSKISLVPEMVAELTIGIADGLHYAHEMNGIDGKPLNMVHRDVSPSNVIVTYKGETKLVDFGIARAESNIAKTAVGMLKGKVQYLSPEQIRGGLVDRRSDLFAFGALTHELLTGNRLFRRENDLATLNAITREDIPAPGVVRDGVPEELDRIVLKCLARNPAQRYQTAAEVSADLRAFLSQSAAPRPDVPTFLRNLFGEERRTRKIGVAQGSLEGAAKGQTPSWQLVRSGDVSPVSGRSHPVPAKETSSRVTPDTAPKRPSSSRGALSSSGRVPVATPPRVAAASDARLKVPPIEREDGPIHTVVQSRSRSRAGFWLGVFSFFFLLGGGGYLAAKTLLESNSGTPAPEGSAPDMPSNMSGSQIASVRFEGLPPDTRLRVDGSAVSPSGETYLSAGTHKLQAEAAGFTSYEGALVVKAGEIRSVKIPLKAKSP